ncbi:hypothetical protein Mapa_017690 [Marchantia paleacea]|nr:hypothetical protein Mapa_017690 [Marchantia paleacea]
MKMGRKGKKHPQDAGSRSYSSPLSMWSKLQQKRSKSRDYFNYSDEDSTSYSCELSHPKFNGPFSMHEVAKGETQKIKNRWIFGNVLDPQSKSIKRTNRIFLLSSSLGMFIDPLFLYTITINRRLACLHVDQGFATAVTVLRCLVDAMYLWHIWLQLKLAYVSKQSLVLGGGELVWDARDIAMHYLCAFEGFIFDLFVILPIPQVMIWVVVPSIIRKEGDITSIMPYMLAGFLFQYIPKVLHLFLVVQRMQRVTGYVFGTAWWGFALNLFCYIVAAHVAGSCWYTLGLERMEQCLERQCASTPNCTIDYVGCPKPVSFLGKQPYTDPAFLAWGASSNVVDICFSQSGTMVWGIYNWVVPLVTDTNGFQKIILPLFWGIMTLSSFGNALTPSNHLVEATFCVIVVTCGLLLFTMLIGNIQVFLHSYTSRKEAMQLQMRDLEWWMRRRQLPTRVRQRVRQFERQKWAATRGVDEAAMVSELPEVLRRDIKRHLCVDLVRQVPLFDQMDDLVVNQICERLKPMLFVKRETVVNAGDPVLRMMFVVRGYIQSEYCMKNGNTSCCVLGPGTFCGDELLSWCFKKPPVQRFPPSTCTLRTLSNCEVFGFEADDLRYITEHFRYKFANEKLKNTARYYSSNWRTWAAVTVQLAWRRFKKQRDERKEREKSGLLYNGPLNLAPEEVTQRTSLGMSEKDRLRLYTAMITSPKPQDHLE